MGGCLPCGMGPKGQTAGHPREQVTLTLHQLVAQGRIFPHSPTSWWLEDSGWLMDGIWTTNGQLVAQGLGASRELAGGNLPARSQALGGFAGPVGRRPGGGMRWGPLKSMDIYIRVLRLEGG